MPTQVVFDEIRTGSTIEEVDIANPSLLPID